MIARTALLALLLSLLAPVASGAGVRIEGVRHIRFQADWPAVLDWADQLHRVRELERRHAKAKTPPRALVTARKKLAKLAESLGKRWPQTWEIRADRLRVETSDSVFLTRFAADGTKVQITPANRTAIEMPLPFARQVAQGTRPPGKLRLVKTNARPRKLFGRLCQEYRIEGRGRGEVWIADAPKPLLETLTACFTAATKHVAGYEGSLLYHAVRQASGVPVLARFSGVKGMTPSGNSLGASTVLCYPYLGAGTAKDEAFTIPEGTAITRLPPRR